MDKGSYGTPAFRNFSRKVQGVLNGLIHNICEVYIDDVLVFGNAFTRNVRANDVPTTTGENSKTLVIGLDKVPFVGHDINATSINTSK